MELKQNDDLRMKEVTKDEYSMILKLRAILMRGNSAEVKRRTDGRFSRVQGGGRMKEKIKVILRIISYLVFIFVCLYATYLIINAVLNSDLPLWLKIMLLR